MSAVIWFVFWLFLSFEKPAYHPYINAEELEMIEKEQGATIINYMGQNTITPSSIGSKI